MFLQTARGLREVEKNERGEGSLGVISYTIKAVQAIRGGEPIISPQREPQRSHDKQKRDLS